MAKTLTVTYNGVNIIDGIELASDATVTYGGTQIAVVGVETKTLKCDKKYMNSDLVIAYLDQQFETPTLTLTDSTISTPIVDGVTKYKVYDNGTYIGYIDADNVWHQGN